MFRLKKEESDRATIVTLDGQLSKDCTAVVEDLCCRAASAGRVVELYLREVGAVDDAGWLMLRRLIQRGVRVRAEGVYTSYMVGALQKNAAPGAGRRIKPR
jgi:hypothetical protein